MFAYFDIGGTKTRIAISLDGHSFADPVKFDTPKNFDEGMERVTETIHSLTNGTLLEAAGGGIAGPTDTEHTMLVGSPNLPEWVGKPLTQTLSSLLNCPVYVQNDTAIVGLGEAHYGAGKGEPTVAYITISTGVGGARIVHGRIDTGMYGFEPGHQFIDFDHSACPECLSPQVEDYLSGTATAFRFHKKAYEVNDPAVWEELSFWLACMLNNTIVHWAPHVVVLGGSMIVGDPAIPVSRVEEHLNDILSIYPKRPKIKKAELQDVGGLYGAMAFVRQKLDRDYSA